MKKILSMFTLCLCLSACIGKVTPEKNPGDKNIARVEIIDMALTMAGIEKNKTCRGDFTDIVPSEENTCRIMETASDHGFINAKTDGMTARPNDNIIRAEALMILMKTFPDDGAWAGYSYYWSSSLPNDNSTTGYKDIYHFDAEWQARVFYDYIRKVLHDDAELKKDPKATAIATREDISEFAKNIMSYKEKQVQTQEVQ